MSYLLVNYLNENEIFFHVSIGSLNSVPVILTSSKPRSVRLAVLENDVLRAKSSQTPIKPYKNWQKNSILLGQLSKTTFIRSGRPIDTEFGFRTNFQPKKQ